MCPAAAFASFLNAIQKPPPFTALLHSALLRWAAMTIFSATEQTEAVSSWLGSVNTQEWLVDRPIKIGITILIGLVANWLLRKSITKAAQININKKPSKISSVLPLRGKANNKTSEALSATQEQRRQSRMLTLAAVGLSICCLSCDLGVGRPGGSYVLGDQCHPDRGVGRRRRRGSWFWRPVSGQKLFIWCLYAH